MRVIEAAEKLGAVLVTGAQEAGARQVGGGYVSDLLSDVMANAAEGDLWVTLQKHVNIVAVAHLKELAAIVLVGGRRPEPAAQEKAQSEQVAIISTELSAWEAVGRLYAAGLRARGQI
ncbi:MAG: serine kinase [Deltaproteobacteria bacterium]|nr:serine kinase [Deltaproteobacteria bacterium]